ncbi:tetratricopeptide repeat protein [Streptomyces sp. NPDC127066]|uniref:tetratricopeptide repeat protein n=1 Tax=Streptomyces sp. NPDC127066 TaxID=3347125 RepID=UPI00364C94D7
MRDEAEVLLSALQARVDRWVHGGDPVGVLDDRAPEEFERLLNIVRETCPVNPPPRFMAVFAEFFRCRYSARPEEYADDLVVSGNLFALVYGVEPGRVPEQLRPLVAESLITSSDPDLWGVLVARAVLGLPVPPGAVDGRPTLSDGRDRPSFLSRCANAVTDLYEETGVRSDLDDSIRLCGAAVDLAGPDHRHRAALLQNLAVGLRDRALHAGSPEDLDRAVDVGREAVTASARPEARDHRATVLRNHGTTLQHRYDRTGRLDDLQHAISAFEEVIGLSADGPNRAKTRSLLSSGLLRRFEHLGNTDDLDRGILQGRQALDGLAADDGGRPAVQGNLGVLLRTRNERVGAPDDLREAMELLRGAVESMDANHPDRSTTLANLGNAHLDRSVLRSSARDLDDGITLLRQAAEAAAPTSRDRYRSLGQLGSALYRRFLRVREVRDIDEAVEVLRTAAETLPDTHIERRPTLNALGVSLLARFGVTDDPEDVERAHRALTECLRISPVGSPDHSGALSNLASTLYLRARHGDRAEDLTAAIDAIRSAVDTTAPDHPGRSDMLTKLSILLRSRSRSEDRPGDLDLAVDAAWAALQAPVSSRPDRAHESLAVAHALIDRLAVTASVPDASTAVALLRKVARSKTADVYARLEAARTAGDLTARVGGRPGTAVDDYDVVELLPLLAWHGLERTSRERLLTQWPGLVRDAAAAAVDALRLPRAVERLEQGRGVMWSQLLAVRGDLTRLSAEHPELAERLADIRNELDKAPPALPEETPAVPVLRPGAHGPEAPRLPRVPGGAVGPAEREPVSSARRPERAGNEDLAALTAEVDRRVRAYRALRDPEPVLHDRASEEARRIGELADAAGRDRVEAAAAVHAVAWLRWCRGRELPGEQGTRESLAALESFGRVWGMSLDTVVPGLVDPGLAARTTEPRPETDPARPEDGSLILGISGAALLSRDRAGLAKAAADLARLAGHLAEDDPFRPLCSAHATAVYMSRFRVSGDDADRREAVRCARDVVAREQAPLVRLIGLSVLGEALLLGFASAGDPGDLDEAVGLLREAVDLAREVEAEIHQGGEGAVPETTTDRARRLNSLMQLANALLARYRVRADASDLDEAVRGCLTAFGLLPPDHLDRLGARKVFVAVLEEVNKDSDGPARLEQSLLLCRALSAITGMPMPSETGARDAAANIPENAEAGRPSVAGSVPFSVPQRADGPAADTHATDVTFGSATVAATVVDDTDHERWLTTVRRICRSGGVVLVPERPSLQGERAGERPELFDLEGMVECVGDCAAVPLEVFDESVTAGLAALPGEPRDSLPPLLGVQVFPCLLAGATTLRNLLTGNGISLPDGFVSRSRPVRTDFREWAHLWVPGDDEESAAHIEERLRRGDGRGVLAYSVAQLLATGHRNGALHGDARWESFGWSPERGCAVILTHDARHLDRPPTPAQCATDVMPLLRSLSRPTWRAFRLGYLRGRLDGPGGRNVIDLIEFGDTTGWMQAMARNDMVEAVDLLGEALDRCGPADQVGRMVITANLAEALSRSGRHEQACAAAVTAWSAGRTLAPDFTPLLALQAGLASLRAGDRDAAVETMLGLIIGVSTPLVSEYAMRVVNHLFPGDGDVPALPDEELPFIARRGDQLVILDKAATSEGETS